MHVLELRLKSFSSSLVFRYYCVESLCYHREDKHIVFCLFIGIVGLRTPLLVSSKLPSLIFYLVLYNYVFLLHSVGVSASFHK